MQCANCGNTDAQYLFDEDDTFSCAKCRHRTLKQTNADDLVWCPYCGMLRDRKTSVCLWCNGSLEDEPPATIEEYKETCDLSDWFIKEMSDQNKRYWRIRKERLTYSVLKSGDYPPIPLHFAPDISDADNAKVESETAKDADLSLISIAIEGKKRIIYGTRYERNPRLRNAAIRLHGCICAVCGFDFEQMYGELGKGFIEVHHINPISNIAEEHEVNAETDLVCVCSNCHRMIHKGDNGIPISIDRLRQLLHRQ